MWQSNYKSELSILLAYFVIPIYLLIKIKSTDFSAAVYTTNTFYLILTI